MYIPLDTQLYLPGWAPFIIGKEMSETQTPKHYTLINNGALSSPSSGASGGYRESTGLAASSRKVETPGHRWSGACSSSARHCRACSLAYPVPHVDWGLRPPHKGGICGSHRGTADCMALRLLLTGKVSAAGRWSTDVWIPLGP